MEAGPRKLNGDTSRDANSNEVRDFCRETCDLIKQTPYHMQSCLDA